MTTRSEGNSDGSGVGVKGEQHVRDIGRSNSRLFSGRRGEI